MENQSSSIDKAVKISIMVGALIVALSVAYYLAIYIPKRDQSKIEREKQEQQEKEQKELDLKKARGAGLSSCLNRADSDYWEYVKLNGTEKKDGTVYALNDVWDRAEKTKKEATDNCFKLFPVQ